MGNNLKIKSINVLLPLPEWPIQTIFWPALIFNETLLNRGLSLI